MREWLLRKLTRERLQPFLQTHATPQPTLEIGASFRPRRELFPALVAGDIAHHPQLDTVFDAHRLPFADEQFACVLCVEVLEHCHTPQQVIDECYRVLQPGGTLILTTRFIFPLHDVPHDYYRYTKYGLRHLCDAYAQVTVEEEAATVVTMGVLLQRLAYQAEWRVPLVKIALLLLAKTAPWWQAALAAEYGDIRKDTPDEHILASGYYVTATKGQ